MTAITEQIVLDLFARLGSIIGFGIVIVAFVSWKFQQKTRQKFEREFAPQHLCNWEVPRYHYPQPVQRKKSTKIISNDRGHLLPGLSRAKSSDSLDNKEHGLELSATKKSHSSKRKDQNKKKFDEDEDLSYKPGDLTELNQQHHSRTVLEGDHSVRLPELNVLYVEKPNKSLETKVNEKIDVRRGCCEQNSPKENSIDVLVEQLPKIEQTMRHEVSEKPGESNTIPLIPAYCNFQAARKMAQENLEHQPLPDSIMDRTFLKMQAHGFLNPELSLAVEPTAKGVGVRTYNAGPTHCTKLKVYRPKTCGVVPPPIGTSNSHSRPQTAFNHKNKIDPMDLAICWDYAPENPLDEPKPSAHIDGSNDTIAPAIFSVVKTPHINDLDRNTGRSAGVFAHTAGEESFFDKDIMLRNKNYFSSRLEKNTDRTCKCSTESRSHSASRKQSSERLRNSDRCKSSPNLSVMVQPSDRSTKESIIVCSYNKEHYHYRPEPTKRHRTTVKKRALCEKSRPLRLCEQNVQQLNQQIDEKTPQCNPFKARATKSQSSGFCSSLDHSSTSNGSVGTATEFTTKVFKIPKPRQPYTKKNYIIDTLAPPFACWKGGAGQGGYPEHWRLE